MKKRENCAKFEQKTTKYIKFSLKHKEDKDIFVRDLILYSTNETEIDVLYFICGLLEN